MTTRIKTYKDWDIYYSHLPRPLWTATKGIEKDIHSYESLERIEEFIDKEALSASNK